MFGGVGFGEFVCVVLLVFMLLGVVVWFVLKVFDFGGVCVVVVCYFFFEYFEFVIGLVVVEGVCMFM